ncbi:bifunctional diguanylate cyclase/phosphodiesterase [Thalassolituus sp. LLYu03]|uniref:bifunctional diguanylate cyclase/phosphodiesterase n=1 Tax=Thalassolituus sp. LLYu03 TaxID=3421656 RepID=UPI003D2D2102
MSNDQSHPQPALYQPSLSIGRYNLFLEMLLSNRPLKSLLEELVLLIQERQPGCIASIMLVTDDGKHLSATAAPDLPDFFRDAVNGIEIGVGVGSCGTAAAGRHLVIVENIQTHPYWVNQKELAAQAGLAACWSQPIVNSSGKVLGVFGLYYSKPKHPTGQDLLLIHEAARLAQASIEFRQAQNQCVLSNTITNHLPVGLLITDRNFTIIEVNPAFSQITGYAADQVLGRTPAMFVNRNEPGLQQYSDIVLRLPQGKTWSGEVLISRRNGERFTAEMSFSVLRNEHNEIERCVALVSDISERKQSEETIQYQASYDLLTGLPNRNLFYQRLNWTLERARRQNKGVAVLLLDLDYFKEINDTLGHDAGDELLVKIGTRLQQFVGRNDTVARLGGDEFGFIIHGISDRAELDSLAERLLNTVGRSLSVRQIRDLRISGSIGISLFPSDGSTLEHLLKAAEQAAYTAKSEGRNQHAFFTRTMHEEAEIRALLHQDLRHAIRNNQLLLHYQPVRDVKSGKITSAEALIRWNHPERGYIRPDIFIPLAEKTGAIREIGEWVRREALAMGGRLLEQNLAIPIAVNVSTAEFYDHSLAQHIVEQVESSGLPKGSLVVEITESVLIRSQQETRSFLQALQAAGIRIALDDFGTGYSSLSYLAAFPADKLKIDRSFIHGMHADARKQTLVDTIINMGHNLGMRVIAEGVETQEDEALLISRGCDQIQGYFLSRPLPEDEFVRFLQNYISTASQS